MKYKQEVVVVLVIECMLVCSQCLHRWVKKSVSKQNLKQTLDNWINNGEDSARSHANRSFIHIAHQMRKKKTEVERKMKINIFDKRLKSVLSVEKIFFY